MEFSQIKSAYFLGIGGIGMSALARYFHERGIRVAGYDRTATELTAALIRDGIGVHYVDDPLLLPPDLDLAVYTPAIPADQTQLVHCRNHQIPLRKRSETLGIICDAVPTIAVAGTHGKTTVSTMTAHLLRAGGIDCSAFLGGIPLNYGSNYLSGENPLTVVEADEYDRSFLHLHPNIALITYIEADHLEIYKNEAGVQDAFRRFVAGMPPQGILILKQNLLDFFQTDNSLQDKGLKLRTYSLDGDADYHASNCRAENGRMYFDFHGPDLFLHNLQINVGGRQNVENAIAAMALCLEYGLKADALPMALATFKGIRRRFEKIYEDDSFLLIDDYAHHPTELRAVIAAVRELYARKILHLVFQPHLYSRTKDFACEFAAVLDTADVISLLPVYAAREVPTDGLDSQAIFDLMKHPARKLVLREEVPDLIATATEANATDCVVLLVGAGDINLLAPQILQARGLPCT